MIEAKVQDAFVNYLKEGGWDVQTHNDDHTDVKAWRGDEVLFAEVKGTTSEPGLDVDTAYGQLLREGWETGPREFDTPWSCPTLPEGLLSVSRTKFDGGWESTCGRSTRLAISNSLNDAVRLGAAAGAAYS
jgi:hypothetical protein